MAKSVHISFDEILACAPSVKDNLTVCVAVSGGRDSVALLHCLKKLENSQDCQNRVKLHVVAVNIEHGIRGESSVRDSEFVARFCKDLNVPLFSFAVNVPVFASDNGYTLEQAGRVLRYQKFDELLDSGKCDLIALAHHRDDQIETVLMRILRGTGIRGLCGMRKVNGKYIRPFLNFDREDIDAYIAEHNLQFVEDETNDDTAYTRNFLRQEIAVLKKRYPNMGESVQRLADSAVEAEEFLEAQVPKIEVKDNEVHIKTCDCANTLIAKRLIFKAANALGVYQDIEDKHYDFVLNLLGAENGKYVMLTHGLTAHKDGDFIVIARNGNEKSIEECAFKLGIFPNMGICIKEVGKSEISFDNANMLFVDADKIPVGTVIRGRRYGDFIHKFGGGTKSLGDFLTDKKVPLRTRNSLVVAACGSQIIAVFGVDISSTVKIDEDTKRVFALIKNKH